jgi:M6 family metalloprotease-like protein
MDRNAPSLAAQPGYLGISLERQSGKLIVTGVDPDSPAARAGVRVGDVLEKAGGALVASASALAETVRASTPGDALPLVLKRAAKQIDLVATLAAVSRPLTRGGRRALLGVQGEPVAEGIRVVRITPGTAADKARLKKGDILIALNSEKLAGKRSLEGLAGKQPGDLIRLTVKRGDRSFEVKARLGSETRGATARGGWDDRQASVFGKSIYRLAVLPIEYPDVKHNPKIKLGDWEKALFSRKRWTGRSPTGQKVHGSLNDYYREVSGGLLEVKGKVFERVRVKKKRAEYVSDSVSRYTLLAEAMDKVLDRDGDDALSGYDGVFFIYAGDRQAGRRGGLYWPHRANFSHRGKRWSYFICPEGGRNMASISLIAHEFGHMLGLPDLYARPEAPGQEGLGIWCTMSIGHGWDGKPLHLSAWCKERMGWLQPAVIDPRTKQKLILSPVEGSTKECYKVLLRRDGSEYLLLENRRKQRFDRDLPAEGLLIWRVVDGRPVLEESHGIRGPSGPDVFLGSIPYPSASNTAFTPYTTPSSRSVKSGGLPVHITRIRKLPDGRITFHIGYEYL